MVLRHQSVSPPPHTRGRRATMKRKRKQKSGVVAPTKKRKMGERIVEATNTDVSHPVLSSYFARTLTLRQYLLEHAPNLGDDRRASLAGTAAVKLHPDLADLLDRVLVASNQVPDARSRDVRAQDLVAFTQQVPQSTIGKGLVPEASLQNEVCSAS